MRSKKNVALASSSSTVTKVTTVSSTFTPIELVSVVLYSGVTSSAPVGGNSSFEFTIDNPNSAKAIIGLILSGNGLSQINDWDDNGLSNSSPGTLSPNVAPQGTSIQFIFWPWSNPSQSINSGQTYNYSISFSDGEVLSGSVVAQ